MFTIVQCLAHREYCVKSKQWCAWRSSSKTVASTTCVWQSPPDTPKAKGENGR